MNVLVDTTVWSIALRRKQNYKDGEQIIRLLSELIMENRVNIIGSIRQEILSGISSHSAYLRLQKKLEAFHDLQILSGDYIRAAEMYNICRRKGIQGSYVDFLICAVSERCHLTIFTVDQDFSHYAKHLPILLQTF